MKKILILTFLTLSVFSETAISQIYPDNEARKAILDLRADVKKNAEENKKLFDKWQSEKRAFEVDASKANEISLKSQQMVREYQNETSKLQTEFEKNKQIQNQSVLQLNFENDLLKQQIAELRGDREQIIREINLISRGQKDSLSLIEVLKRDMEELRAEKDLLFKEIDLLRRGQNGSLK